MRRRTKNLGIAALLLAGLCLFRGELYRALVTYRAIGARPGPPVLAGLQRPSVAPSSIPSIVLRGPRLRSHRERRDGRADRGRSDGPLGLPDPPGPLRRVSLTPPHGAMAAALLR